MLNIIFSIIPKVSYSELIRVLHFDIAVEVRYYFNLDHCVWGLRMNGPDFFAVADKCDNAHYHSTKYNKWKKYRSGKEHRCLPPF